MKKKIIIFMVSIFFLLFILMFVMISFDNRYNSNIIDDIENNTEIDNIEYVNKYDNYYIVMDNKYLYLFTSLYEEITRVEIDLIHNNRKNYDIVYRNNNLFYMNDYENKGGLVFEYYDIYKYELVDKIVLGGNR